jgi:outer membrane protein TolC
MNASRFSYYSSYNGLLPNLTLSNNFTHNNNSGGVVVGSPNLYTAQLTANMNIFNMASIASIKSTKASYSQAEANLRNASAALRYNLISAFANVYFSQAALEMTRRILVIQEKNAEEVTLRYLNGNEYKGNMMNAKAQLLVQQANVVQAVRSLRAATKQLDQYLGLEEFDAVSVTGTLVAQIAPDLPSHLNEFLANVPSVAVQEAVVKNARASLLNSESPLFPNLSVTFSRYREATYEFPDKYLGSYGATLSYPIFGSGPASAYFNVKAARNTLANQEQTLRAVRVAAQYNLENAWANYANAVDQAVGEQAVLESYRQRNDEGAVRYASGLLTFDNWQVIVTQWVGAEQTALTNWQQAVTAQAAWEQALGKALGE